MSNVIIYFISLIIFSSILYNLNITIINIYNYPIFKLIFLFGLYTYGNYDHILSLLIAIYYVYLGQVIKEKELLYNIV
jgi:hypothetical protein